MASNAPSHTPDNTKFSYDFYGSKPTDLIYDGDAHFPADTTYLRLTQTDAAATPLQNSIGRVIYSDSILFWRPGAHADFKTTVKFVLKPSSVSNPADGLVFFMAPVNHTFPSNSSGGNLGIFGESGASPAVFAVEFDVFVNGEWDPNFPHVGIHIESRASKSVAQIPPSFIGKEVTLTASYVAATGVICAAVTDGSTTVEASYVYDLSGVLPQQVHVGLAAATGGCVAIHDVAAWDFDSTLVKKN